MGQQADSQEEVGMVGASPRQIAESRQPKKPIKQSTQEDKVRLLAEEKGLPYVDLTDFKIEPKVLSTITKRLAKKLRAIPYLRLGSQVRIATDQLVLIEEEQNRISRILAEKKLRPQLVLASSKSIEKGLQQLENSAEQKEEASEAASYKGSPKKVIIAKKENGAGSLVELREKIAKIPTTELLQILLSGAIKNRASDIHIVPQEEAVRIRFRVDGVLQDIIMIPTKSYQKLLHRIKYHSKIKMNIKNRPQDGRFETKVANGKYDIRVSTFPSINGETIVMRLLEEEKEFYELDRLGFNKEVLTKVKKATSQPSGMILNTGPTGSGKTTTLYAILEKINQPQVKIITLEDPVEYHLAGITQTQIDPDHQFTFAKGLKHALRQDPDILMIGEIRGKETATTALHAALTGHLVLTTLHTNNASSAFIRLLDMGVKPFFLVGSINLAIAQRLIRKLCQKCKESYRPSQEEIQILKKLAENENLKAERLYRAKGCSACNQTGFRGRTAISEAIIPTKKIERVILGNPTQRKIEETAKKEKTTTITQDGVTRVLKGTTSMEELLRVVAE